MVGSILYDSSSLLNLLILVPCPSEMFDKDDPIKRDDLPDDRLYRLMFVCILLNLLLLRRRSARSSAE